MELSNTSSQMSKNKTQQCSDCLVFESNQVLLHFTTLSKSARISCSVLLMILVIVSMFLNISSIYFILHEVRRRTHVNLLLSSQSLADLLINILVMLPISILALSDVHTKPNYQICLAISFLDHWFQSVTMLNLAAIILDRYMVIVQRQLSAVTSRIEKSMAVMTVIWLTTFIFDISYIVPFLQHSNWIKMTNCPACDQSKSLFQWIDEILNRIAPFLIILFCFFRMLWLKYKSKHRVGVKNGIANWRTILIGIYAKSVNTCLVIMTLFLIGTFPDLAILVILNWRKTIGNGTLIFAIWMRFSMTAIKPGIYMMQSRKFSFCWWSSCCRNVNMTKLVTLSNRPSTSVRHSYIREAPSKVTFTKAHDLFSIKLHIEELEASRKNTSETETNVRTNEEQINRYEYR